jgi:hypothetical protein
MAFVFLLAVMPAEPGVFDLPGSINDDLQVFVDAIAGRLTDKAVFNFLIFSTF